MGNVVGGQPHSESSLTYCLQCKPDYTEIGQIWTNLQFVCCSRLDNCSIWYKLFFDLKSVHIKSAQQPQIIQHLQYIHLESELT